MRTFAEIPPKFLPQVLPSIRSPLIYSQAVVADVELIDRKGEESAAIYSFANTTPRHQVTLKARTEGKDKPVVPRTPDQAYSSATPFGVPLLPSPSSPSSIPASPSSRHKSKNADDDEVVAENASLNQAI
jgi:hypothetical protein